MSRFTKVWMFNVLACVILLASIISFRVSYTSYLQGGDSDNQQEFTQHYGSKLAWESQTELYWQDVIQSQIGGKVEFKLDDNTRVDILLDDWACEIDWQNKWAEGIGQSIYYGLKTGKKPLVILLAKRDGWEKYRDRVEFCNITCWVFDTRIRTWLDKE